MSSLTAASLERKARLAALKSKSHKRPASDLASGPDAEQPTPKSPKLSHPTTPESFPYATPNASTPQENASASTSAPDSSTTRRYLSGRNYDIASHAPKLGFEHDPSLTSTTGTLELRAEVIIAVSEQEAREKAKKEKEAGAPKPLDLLDLQPKKPNWDLKRDLEEKLKVLNVRTENALVKIVRERIAGDRERARLKAAEAGSEGKAAATSLERETLSDGEQSAIGPDELGMDGNTFVRAVQQREMEEAEDEMRIREEAEQLEND